MLIECAFRRLLFVTFLSRGFLAAWSFFNERIPFEESLLRRQFPEYEAYAQTVGTGIPFIK